jgi:hypothetical protein
MDIFDEEILRFWKALFEYKVEYIMVGGYATNIHGFQRYTGDMDIWIKDSIENRLKIRKAFLDINMGDYDMLEKMQFVAGWSDFKLNNGLQLDIMTTMKGLEDFSFDECISMATIATIEKIEIPFLHLNHLIANKKAVNRPKDQIDVIELEKIKKIREEEET